MALKPKLWVPPRRQAMSFFQLHRGQLKLPERRIDPHPSSDGGVLSTWKGYHYAQFPWQFRSMKTIEGFFDTRPILKGLSFDQLPNTNRPMPMATKRSMSRMKGYISGLMRTRMHSTSWLCTDEVQFLLAFLLRNEEKNKGVFHVLGPMITHKVSIVYQHLSAILKGTATDTDHRAYQSNLEDIQNYIETRLDIFEHKFLVFELNVSDTHWISVVVVNPLLVLHPDLEKGNEHGGSNALLGDDDFAGWCVLNSTQRPKERKHHGGFQGTK